MKPTSIMKRSSLKSKILVSFLFVILLSGIGLGMGIRFLWEIDSLSEKTFPLVEDIEVLSQEQQSLVDLSSKLENHVFLHSSESRDDMLEEVDIIISGLENISVSGEISRDEVESLKTSLLQLKQELRLFFLHTENVSYHEGVPGAEDVKGIEESKLESILQNIDESSSSLVELIGKTKNSLDKNIAHQDELGDAVVRELFFVIIITIIFGLVTSILLSNYIIDNLRELKQFLSDVAAGNFSSRYRNKSDDEFGELAVYADSMRKELKSFNQDLETKVIDKTKELKKANMEIVKMLKFKSNFLNQVAHDIRTPITVMGLSLNLINFPKKDPKDRKNFRILKNNMNYLTELVNDVLNISRIDSGKISLDIQKKDIGKVIRKVFTNYTNMMKHEKIKVELNIPKNIPSVYIDEAKISEVVQNLISNSIKHLKGISKPKVKVSCKKKRGFVEVEFKDNGKGVPKDKVAKLFEEFYKVDDSGQDLNSGLGLSITQRIIEKHGGKITAKSEGVGEGLTIIFTLPTKKPDITKTRTSIEKNIADAENYQKQSPESILKNVSPELRKKMQVFKKNKEHPGESLQGKVKSFGISRKKKSSKNNREK